MTNTLYMDLESIPIERVVTEARFQALAEGKDDIEPETLLKLSTSALTARVLCIGYALNDQEPLILNSEGAQQLGERLMLEKWWQICGDPRQCHLVVGYNIMDFDLRFIRQRSYLLDVHQARVFPATRYRNSPVFDLMHEWSQWSYRDNCKMDDLAKAFGFHGKTEGIDGSKVYENYLAGNLELIYQYCRQDVETARQIYQKIKV